MSSLGGAADGPKKIVTSSKTKPRDVIDEVLALPGREAREKKEAEDRLAKEKTQDLLQGYQDALKRKRDMPGRKATILTTPGQEFASTKGTTLLTK